MQLMVSQGNVDLNVEFEEFFLAPIKAISASNVGVEIEKLQVCYNFSTERLILKIVLGLAFFSSSHHQPWFYQDNYRNYTTIQRFPEVFEVKRLFIERRKQNSPI